MAGMTLQDINWMLLVVLFLVSLLIVLAWLVQYSRAILRARSHRLSRQEYDEATRSLQENLPYQIRAGGVWGTLLKLRFGRDGGGGDTEAGVKGLLSSLFSFRSFRENWLRAWVRALNEQAYRDGVLQCSCEVDTVTFPVSVTQQSPAAVSMDTYQVTIEPMQVQLVVCLEEVEEEGLLVSWTFSQQPLLNLTVSPRRIQREMDDGSDDQVDVNTITELVEDTLFSTQPAMIINLKACVSSPGLRAAEVRGGVQCGWAELCCALDLTPPTQEKRTRFLPPPSSPGVALEWNEDITLELGQDTKELRIRLVERNSKGEQFLPGQASLPLDLTRRSPTGKHMLSVSPGQALSSSGTVTFELLFLEPGDPRGGQGTHALRPSLTPTKKVEMDRTIMPDGTIVTTVTTIQSRPKLDRKLESPTRSPSKVEVTEKKPTLLADGYREGVSPTSSSDSHLSNGLDPVAETAIRQLTESASKAAKKTPTKRSTLIISGVSKVPIAEDDTALSIGYAASMDAALLGDCSPGSLNHYASSSHGAVQQDPDETTPSDISERPSVDDVESETGSTGALETRSLKDHKVGFLRSGTKLLFRRRHRQKDPSLSQSHEDVSNLGNGSTMRKKSGSFSRRLIKRFSFRSKSKGKASTNGGAGATEN
ncbi:hypothetical protein JZ751_022703 [Albula glossodonta]|uniref:Synaptotagmin-like mitochondrial and lipid-binding domain-containing protein n=1 Tax=Albula glossodonta TaxID=121402 RepID=A0A8T2PDP2_9TELE|nr:hypothetical protein JZ751_022703 [Albula glossodonta]